MTVEEVKAMLKSARSVERQAARVREKIELNRELYGSVKCGLGGIVNVQGGERTPQQEYVCIRLEDLYNEYGRVLNELCALQKEIASALISLDPIEREIINGVMDGKTYEQIGIAVGYSDSTVKRKKRAALKKIAENTKVDPP